jgi:hypothetical protein
MNSKPDVMVWLAIIVAFGAVLTGFMSPDESQASIVVSEALIR